MQKYISGLVTVGRQNATAHRALAPAKHSHEVHTISRGHATDDSTKARKDSVRRARDIALGHQINMGEHVAKLSRRENTVISFTDDKVRRLIHPYTNSLVVTLSVANEKVFCILIDTGSSAEILIAFAFRQINVGGATTRPIKTPLYGFRGEMVYAEGAIQLLVTFGQRLTQTT